MLTNNERLMAVRMSREIGVAKTSKVLHILKTNIKIWRRQEAFLESLPSTAKSNRTRVYAPLKAYEEYIIKCHETLR